MNREIKFRCWDKLENKMYWNVQNTYDMSECHAIAHIDYPGLNKDGTICQDSCNGHDFYPSSFGEVLRNKNYIVMQYTGLKDKNGKEIYEGDILIRIFNDREYGENYIVDKIIPLNKLLWSDCYSFSEEYEVIGNVYENKELLK